eukprot:322449-Chlamydomonas_euryale.AAC.1
MVLDWSGKGGKQQGRGAVMVSDLSRKAGKQQGRGAAMVLDLSGKGGKQQGRGAAMVSDLSRKGGEQQGRGARATARFQVSWVVWGGKLIGQRRSNGPRLCLERVPACARCHL